MTERSTPLVLRPGEGRPIDLGNFAMSLKASTAETDGAFTLLEATEPADFGPPLARPTPVARQYKCSIMSEPSSLGD